MGSRRPQTPPPVRRLVRTKRVYSRPTTPVTPPNGPRDRSRRLYRPSPDYSPLPRWSSPVAGRTQIGGVKRVRPRQNVALRTVAPRPLHKSQHARYEPHTAVPPRQQATGFLGGLFRWLRFWQ